MDFLGIGNFGINLMTGGIPSNGGPDVAHPRGPIAEIDYRAELARLERENAIMRQAIRKSQHYLGRYLEPGNLSATECINWLLKTLDNEEINEVTKR